jgi:hypothetical protein
MAELKVVPFTGPKKAIDEDREGAVNTIKEMLADAEKGRITAVSIAYVRPEGSVGTIWSPGEVGPMLGAVALLQFRLIDQLESIDEEEDEDEGPPVA